MREPMEAAFAEDNRLGIPVILDTDTQSKCDKYTYPEMTLAGTLRFGEYGVLYYLVEFPDEIDAPHDLNDYPRCKK